MKVEQKVHAIFPRFIVGQIVCNNSSFPCSPMASISSINPLLRIARGSVKMGRNRYDFAHGVKHRFVKRFEHFIYIYMSRQRLVEDISTRYNLATKGWDEERDAGRGEGEERERKNVRIPSSESLVKGSLFFPPGKFIRRNATVAIFVLQISRDETRALNLPARKR